MNCCTCTCSTAVRARIVASTSKRLLSTSAPRRQQQQKLDDAGKGKGSSRLEWDTSNKQWIRKAAPAIPQQQRPGPAERAKILQELKEQRINEVTEPSADAPAQAQAEPTADTTTMNKDESGEEKKNVSTSGRKYMRGQDSSTLQVQVADKLEGVEIPIRPLPPESTDCCMSGCPRCVYDIYTEDLQLHFEAMDKARKALQAKKVSQDRWPVELRKFANAASSRKQLDKDKQGGKKDMTMQYDSDDADGISAFDIASQVVTDEIQDLDISLRTFLKFERELRQRRKRERAQKMAMDHVSSMPSSQPSAPAPRANA